MARIEKVVIRLSASNWRELCLIADKAKAFWVALDNFGQQLGVKHAGFIHDYGVCG